MGLVILLYRWPYKMKQSMFFWFPSHIDPSRLSNARLKTKPPETQVNTIIHAALMVQRTILYMGVMVFMGAMSRNRIPQCCFRFLKTSPSNIFKTLFVRQSRRLFSICIKQRFFSIQNQVHNARHKFLNPSPKRCLAYKNHWFQSI